MADRIDKIPPLVGNVAQRTEQLRTQVNRVVDEINRALDAKDREIKRLREEIRNNERK